MGQRPAWKWKILQQLEVSPNPIRDQFEVSFFAPQQTELGIGLFDLMGRQVANLYQGQAYSGNNEFHISVTDYNLPSGTYHLQMATPKGVISRKVLKVE